MPGSMQGTRRGRLVGFLILGILRLYELAVPKKLTTLHNKQNDKRQTVFERMNNNPAP